MVMSDPMCPIRCKVVDGFLGTESARAFVS
jgi:hypothetical protein